MATYNFRASGELNVTEHAPLLRTRPTVQLAERFELEVATTCHDRPDLLFAWQRMLASSPSSEKLYQSPEFFRHLLDTQQGETRHEMFIVRRRADYTIVGVIPVSIIKRHLDFRVGSASLFKRDVQVCQMLGSVPLLNPAEDGLYEFVTSELLSRFPECSALYMQAAVNALEGIAGLSTYALNGWRDCHTQPLPDSVDAYLETFSAKNRYNLSRQVRRLKQRLGDLEVVRVEESSQVEALYDARDEIAPWLIPQRAASEALAAELARQGQLLCYVIRGGGQDVALVSGMRSDGVWHVQNIYRKKKYLHLSLGSSAVHLAVQDVLTNFDLHTIEFGHGSPSDDFRSIHVLETFGQAVSYRAWSFQSALLKTHNVCSRLNGTLIRQVRRARKKLAQHQ